MMVRDWSAIRRKWSLAALGGVLAVGSSVFGPMVSAHADDPALHDAPVFTDTGAYGYFAGVSLFGGPINKSGPDPVVNLPAGGSATPITASIPEGKAQFGPAVLIQSGQETISTQGTPGGDVTSNTEVLGDPATGPGPLLYSKLTSTCSSTGGSLTGSVTMAGQLAHSTTPDGDPTGLVDFPPNPAPNTEDTGIITNVGDNFRVVYNEQISNGGLLTVNSIHMYLLGPTAVGDLIIGQSRCGQGSADTTTTTVPGDTTQTTTGGDATGTSDTGRSNTGTSSSTSNSSDMPTTGTNVVPLVVIGLELLLAGAAAIYWANRRRAWPLR